MIEWWKRSSLKTNYHHSMKYFNMSQKEVDRIEVITRSIRKELTVKDASVLMGLSRRQTLRPKAGVKEKGAHALAHGNRGRENNN